MGFERYNMKAHNRALGYCRTMVANRRNAKVLTTLRAMVVIPTDRYELYDALQTHSGKLPWSVAQKLSRQVRRERGEVR